MIRTELIIYVSAWPSPTKWDVTCDDEIKLPDFTVGRHHLLDSRASTRSLT